MPNLIHNLEIFRIFISPGHDFKGRHGHERHQKEERTSMQIGHRLILANRAAGIECAATGSPKKTVARPRGSGDGVVRGIGTVPGSHRGVDRGREIGLVGDADDLLDHFAVLHDDDRRDRHDLELGGDFAIGIDVDLADLGATFVVTGELVDGRGERSAGAAPLRPVIYNNRLIM